MSQENVEVVRQPVRVSERMGRTLASGSSCDFPGSPARLDRELTDRAVWLPTVTGRSTDIVSRRVGNYQYHPLWGVLLDQLWVR